MSTEAVLRIPTIGAPALRFVLRPAAVTSLFVNTGPQSSSRSRPSELLARWGGRYCAGYFEDVARQAPDALLAALATLRPGYLVLALDSVRHHLPVDVYRADVLPLLEHRSPMVREATAYALGKQLTETIRARLARLSEQDPSEAVREAARNVLAE